MTVKRSRATAGIVLLGAVAIITAACSSGGSTTSASATTANPAVLGPVKAATGEPLKIGYIYAGQTQTTDDRPELAMARATVKYVNQHLGGVAGRPLELVVCADNVTPAGATDCTNQMLAAKVPVVLQSEPANPAQVVKLLEPAKVPYFTWQGADASLLTSADASVIGNPLILLAAPIKLAKDDGVKKVAMVYVDVPAAAQLKVIAAPLYKNAGLGLVSTAVPLGTPDVTPQIQAALSDGAKEFLVVGDDSLCINSLKALKTLGFNGKTVTNTNCLKTDGGKSLPGGIDGVTLAAIESPDASNGDVALFHAVAATYAPGTPTDQGLASAGYAVVLGFARAMTDLSAGDVTPAVVAAALKAMPPQTMPLLTGETFRCSRTVAVLTPGVCSNGGALVTLKPNGVVQQSTTFDATPYLKAG
jgi:branched-chain amino acid transport system substrate-binding protein